MTAIGMSHPPRVHRRVGGQRTALTAGIGLLLAALVLTTIANPPAAFAHTAQLSTATPAPAVAATDANDVPTWPFVVGPWRRLPWLHCGPFGAGANQSTPVARKVRHRVLA